MTAKAKTKVRRLGLVLAFAASACATFADVSTVVDLRVLAVETDPSEVILTVTGLPTDPAVAVDPMALAIEPASIPTIHLTPLVVEPPSAAGRTLTYSLSACPNNPYGAAPPMNMGGGGPDPSGGARTTVGSTTCDGAPLAWAFGSNPTGIFDVTLTPEQLAYAFMHDIYLDQDLRFHGGFDLGLPINFQLTVDDGVETAVAIKRVLFWAQKLPGQVANVPPAIPVIHTYADRTAAWDPIAPIGTLDADTPAHVALGAGLWLEPILPPEDVESYVTTVIDRDPPHLAVPITVPRERLRYAFYATAGHFDPARTVSELPPGVAGRVHLESHYLPPAKLDDVPVDATTSLHLVTVWIVVRDDRGGETWATGHLALAPAP
ncbi:MAG: putative lipoprotein [Myxococcales bacterium]|nr:putative lipoprotein [Myxococcales bacterium]